MKEDKSISIKKEDEHNSFRPPEEISVAFVDVEILRDDKFIQFSQISCLVIRKDGESKRSFSARISPQYLDTYSHYKQSSDLLTVLGQWIDQDSKRMLVKDKEDVVEVQTERQAMAGLVEFLKHEKYILVFNSLLVLAMLREKIGSEWVDETMARAVSLESFFKLYRPQLEVVSCDTEDLLAKVMARDPVKLENCAAASSAMYELINFVRMSHSKSKHRSLESFILKCSSPVKSVETPRVNLKHFGLDERTLTFIEVKSSYERSVSTLIQLSYIEIHFLADEEEDGADNGLLVKVKKDETETEYAEPPDTKFFPVFDVDEVPAGSVSLDNRVDLAADTSSLSDAQDNGIAIEGTECAITSPLSMVPKPVENLAAKHSSNKPKDEAKSTLLAEFKIASVGCKDNTNMDVITISDDESEAEESPGPSEDQNSDVIVPEPVTRLILNVTGNVHGGSFETLASTSEGSSATSSAAALTVATPRRGPAFPKSAAVSPPLQAPESAAPPTNQLIGPSCYQAMPSHKKCQQCRANDGCDQIQSLCKKCPHFNLITWGFAGSGKFCVAMVVGLPKSILSLRVFIAPTNEVYCAPVFSYNAKKFVMLSNNFKQVMLPSTTISTNSEKQKIGVAQVSCLEKEVWRAMKNETIKQFNEWLVHFTKFKAKQDNATKMKNSETKEEKSGCLEDVEDERLTHTEFEERYPVQRSQTTIGVKTVWFNEKDRLFLAKVPDTKKARKIIQNAEYLRVSGLPYESHSTMKGSFIFKPTNRSYILLPHVPTSFQGRRNFHVIADVKTLPIKNIYTADQVAHQKSLMLAESERKKALAEQNGGFDNRRNTTFLPTHYETYHPQGYNDQPRRKDEDYAKDMSNSRKRKKVNKCRGSKKKANW